MVFILQLCMLCMYVYVLYIDLKSRQRPREKAQLCSLHTIHTKMYGLYRSVLYLVAVLAELMPGGYVTFHGFLRCRYLVCSTFKVCSSLKYKPHFLAFVFSFPGIHIYSSHICLDYVKYIYDECISLSFRVTDITYLFIRDTINNRCPGNFLMK